MYINHKQLQRRKNLELKKKCQIVRLRQILEYNRNSYNIDICDVKCKYIIYKKTKIYIFCLSLFISRCLLLFNINVNPAILIK